MNREEQGDRASPSGRATAASQSNPQAVSSTAGIPDAVAIGITGTQSGLTDGQKEMLCSILVGFREGGSVWQHNGDCIGADEYAGKLWRTLGGKIHLHPPTNRSKRAFLTADASDEPKPYLDRNGDIAAQCDILVALPKEAQEELRSGTWATVRRARKLGRTIILVLPNGRWTLDGPAQAMSAFGQDPQGLEAKPASAVAESHAPKDASQATQSTKSADKGCGE